MACVSDNEVAALVEGQLPEARRAELLAEIAQCASCRSLLHDCLVASASPDGSPRAHEPVALPAEVAGYRLGDVLGAGSGGVVVRARDPVLDRDVALKLVRTTGDGDPAAHALREARTLATLRHPAIVAVYATGASEHLGYVAMELVEGASLAARIARGPVPWREAVAQFAEVAAGLAAIHAAGLVHRDLKPGNLLVDGDRLRIADFGLAVRDPSAALAGTLPYLAPERLAGGAADAASDQYALFASLFEAITGTRPYRELDRRALQAAAEHGHPAWPSHVPAALRAVVERGLAPAPADRHADATAARAALRGLLAERPRWPLVASVAGGVLAIAAGVAVALSARGDACEAAMPAWSAASPQLARYGTQLARAETLACRDDAPARRACLERADRRAAALLAATAPPVDRDRAVLELPAPSACDGAGDAEVVAAPPAELAALASAQAWLGLREARRAQADVAGIASASPLAGDAELVRGRAALDLEDDAAAVTAFRRTAELAVTTHRDDLAIAAANGLAVAVGMRQHEPAAGEAYATAAYTAAMKLGDLREAGVARRTIGWLAFQAGDAPRANQELASALDLSKQAGAPLDVASAELMLGRIARTNGDYAAASEHVERAYALRRDALGAEHPDTIAIDADRATIDAANGEPARAKQLITGEIARLEAVYGAHHRALATPLTNLGSALAAGGDYVGAGSALERALAIDREANGELDRSVAKDYANLAGMRVVEGKFDDAAALYRAALASARSVLGDQHPDLAPMYAGLGVALASAKHYDDAAAALASAIAVWRAHPGHDDELARALAQRSLISLGQHDLDSARRDADDALVIMTRMHGPDHVALVSPLSALGQAELAANHLDAARAAMEKAIAIHERTGAKPRQMVEERVVLAHVLWQQGHHEDGLALARRALADLAAPDTQLAHDLVAWIRTPG